MSNFKTTLLLASISGVVGLNAQQLRVHTIGDSTMADYIENTTLTRGWGEMFQEFFTPDVTVLNYARGGRSSRSFYEEGRWELVKNNLQPGDYVLIQFAHNDAKEGGLDGADGRGTAPWTTYKSFLEKYVVETRLQQGVPVFVTPIVRRYFGRDGRISTKGCHDLGIAPDDSTLNYVRVMKHVAREMHVPVIDHTALTKQFVEKLGQELTTKSLYVPTDGTHTQATGAVYFARLVADEMKSQGILDTYINTMVPLVVNPTHCDFGTIYVGSELSYCFDITGIELPHSAKNVIVQAPNGMQLATSLIGERREKLIFATNDQKLWNTQAYLFYHPQTEGNLAEKLIVSWDGGSRSIALSAINKVVMHQTPLRVHWSSFVEPAEITGGFVNGLHELKGLQTNEKGVTIEDGKWSAEIDEAASRFIQFSVSTGSKNALIREVSFKMNGSVAYRVAYAKGKDFYPRMDIAESVVPHKDGESIVIPVNISLKSGEQLFLRVFPWSPQESENLSIEITDFVIQGSEIE